MKRLAGMALIVLGLMIIFYPWAQEIYYKQQQEKTIQALVDSWEADCGQKEPEYEPEEAAESGEEADDSWSRYIKGQAEGILQIKKISLRLPILKGATETNLNLSAARIEGSGKPGEEGNYCIAAHHSRFYGCQFNRLNELEAGDQVEIVVKDNLYQYQVYDKMMVKADDTWVLQPEEGESLLTLITCDYREKMYPRLIVKARLKP